MGRKQDEELKRIENHLSAAEELQVDSAKAYNRDASDVDIDRYSQRVEGKKKGGCLAWLVILVTVAVLGIFLCQVWGGS